MNAAIGKLLTQFDANGRVKSPPLPPPKAQDPVTRPKDIRREPQPQLQTQPQPQSPAPKAETPPANLRRCPSAWLCRWFAGRRGQARRGARPQRDPARRGAGQMVRPAGSRDRQRLRDGLPRDRNQHRELRCADFAAIPRRCCARQGDRVSGRADCRADLQFVGAGIPDHGAERPARPGQGAAQCGQPHRDRIPGRRCRRGSRSRRSDGDRDADLDLDRTPEGRAPVVRHE